MMEQTNFKIEQKVNQTLNCDKFGIRCSDCRKRDYCKFRKSYKKNFGIYPEENNELTREQLKKLKRERE